MKNDFYLPILKSKLGEFTALAKLEPFVKEHMAPLFEITPLEWDQQERKKPRTLEDHLDAFCKRVIEKWGTNRCFIDTGLLNYEGTDNTPRIGYVFDQLAAAKLIPVPVVRVNSSSQFIFEVIGIRDRYSPSEIAIRVNPSDVTSPNFETSLTTIIAELNFSPNKIHLLFDLGDAKFVSVDDIAESILSVLEVFPFLLKWKSFTIAGTAFPSSSAIKEGLHTFERNDWKFYKALIAKMGDKQFYRSVNYGDYSIVNPGYFEFNPRIMKASANIRYTHDNVWVVAKGKALKTAVDYIQYKKLSKEIFVCGLFMGEHFSQGDLHLAKCVRAEVKPGSPSVWNWVGNSHHFTKVVTDLYASPPES